MSATSFVVHLRPHGLCLTLSFAKTTFFKRIFGSLLVKISSSFQIYNKMCASRSCLSSLGCTEQTTSDYRDPDE